MCSNRVDAKYKVIDNFFLIQDMQNTLLPTSRPRAEVRLGVTESIIRLLPRVAK